MTSFQTERRVDWGDCDAAGIVFYPNYYRWMDSHYHLFTEAIGFDQRTIQSEHDLFGTPLKDTGCSFNLPVRFGDTLRVASHLTALNRSSFRVAYTFCRDMAQVAEGFEVRVMVKQTPGGGIAASRIPPPLHSALAAYVVTAEINVT